MIPFLVLRSVKQFVIKRLFNRFFLFFIFSSLVLSAKKEWQSVHSFEKEWLVYQPNMNIFLPYISAKHSNYKSKSLVVNPSDFPRGYLKIEPSQNYTLFINGVFIRKLPLGTLIRLNVDSLAKKDTLSDRFVITIYGEALIGIPKNISIDQNVEKQDVKVVNSFELKIRKASTFNNFFSFAILSLLALMGYLFFFFPKYFQTYFRFSDWLRWEIKDLVIAKIPFALPNLLVIFILSLITAYLAYFNAFLNFGNQISATISPITNVFSEVFLFFGTKILIAFGIFVFRLFIYKLFCSLFKLNNLAEIHFFKSIQTNIQFFSVLIFYVLLYSVYMGPNFMYNLSWVSTAVGIYFLIRAIYFFIIFERHFRCNPLYLITYLVIVEGQVLLFGIRELIFPEFL